MCPKTHQISTEDLFIIILNLLEQLIIQSKTVNLNNHYKLKDHICFILILVKFVVEENCTIKPINKLKKSFYPKISMGKNGSIYFDITNYIAFKNGSRA